MLGAEYIIDHCISAFETEAKEEGYRRYTAEVLRLMGENIARATNGAYIAQKWGEKPQKEDERTADEIALDIITRAGLRVKESGESI